MLTIKYDIDGIIYDTLFGSRSELWNGKSYKNDLMITEILFLKRSIFNSGEPTVPPDAPSLLLRQPLYNRIGENINII